MGVLFRSRDLTGMSRRLNAAATPSVTSDLTGLPLVRATLPSISPWSGAIPTPSPIQTMPAANRVESVQRVPLTPAPMATNMSRLESPLIEPPRRGTTTLQATVTQPVSAPSVMRQAVAPTSAIGGVAASQPASTPTVQPIAESIPSLTTASAVPLPSPPLTATPSAAVQTSKADPIVLPPTVLPTTSVAQRQPSVSQVATTPASVTTTTPPAAPPVMRAAAPQIAASTTSSTSAAPKATPSSEVAPAADGEPTLDKEWSRLERIMQLHRKKAEEAGAEPGVIPAPPPPAEPTHLQKMEEKQKRINTPSRMPPPELRRRAEVVTFSPEEAKGKTPTAPSLSTHPSASVTPVTQRSTALESDTMPQPQVSPTQPVITETETEMPDITEAAATPATMSVQPVQRQTPAASGSGESSRVRPQAEPTPPPVTSVPRITSEESDRVRPQTGPAEVAAATMSQLSRDPELSSAPRELITPVASESGAQPITTSQNLQRQVSASSESSVTQEAADLPVTPAMVESGNVPAAAPPTTPVQRQIEAQPIPSTPDASEQTPAASTVPATPATSPASQPVQRQVEPTTHSTKTAQPEAGGTADSSITRTEQPLTQTESVASVPEIEDAIVQTMPAAAPSPMVQPIPHRAEQPDVIPPGKMTEPVVTDTSVPAQPLPPQVQRHPVEQSVPVMRQPETTTAEPLPAHAPALAESAPTTPVTRSTESVQRQTAPTVPPSVPPSDSLPQIETPLPTDAAISRKTEPEPMSSRPDPKEGLSISAESAAAPVQQTAAEPATSAYAAKQPSSPMASGVPDSSVQRAAAPSLGQHLGQQSEPEVDAKPIPPVQRTTAAPVRAETGMAAPLPVVKARPLPELVTPAIPPEAPTLPIDVPERTPESVQRAAATLSPDITPAALPPAAALPASEAETTVPPVQRAVTPQPLAPVIATQPDVSELDMPTMIMPVPVSLSQPETTHGAATPHPTVQRHVETPQTTQPTVVAPDVAAEPEPERWSLADVWPVQRKEESRPVTEHEAIEPVETAEPMRHDKPEAKQVDHVMRQVAAAKPSDSSVELILPRRQRPTLPPRTPAPSAPSVQTQPENNGGRSKPPTETTQAFVPTEIGPLPGDLWEILGTPVPAAAAPAPPAPAPTAPTQTSVMRALAAAESQPPQPTFRNGDGPHLEAIQRAETTPEQSRPTSTATAGSGVPPRTATAQEGQSGQGTEGGGEQDEVNVDELARQVYHEVRRRLSVEWERGRGRF